jgi:hypothetical protein
MIMAHECPECGQCCYCNGDIDDMLLNTEEDVIACDHCPCDGSEDEEMTDEEYAWHLDEST